MPRWRSRLPYSLSRWATSLEGLDPDELVEPELHRFASFDGLNVPFWVYRGKGSSRSVAIEIHGGPEGQEQAPVSVL